MLSNLISGDGLYPYMGHANIYKHGTSELQTVAVRRNCAFPGSAAGDWSEPCRIHIPVWAWPSTPTVSLVVRCAHAWVPGPVAP